MMLDGFYKGSRLKKYKITIFFLILVNGFILAQNGSNRFFSTGTEIEIDNLPENDIYYSHVYDNSVTIYSLAEFFKVSKETLWRDSNIDPNKPINAGKIVKVHLDKNRIVTIKPKSEKYYTLTYKVSTSETLFSISRKFNTDVLTLKSLNNKSSNDIKIGELIVIGYYLPYGNQKVRSLETVTKIIDNKANILEDNSPLESDDIKVTKYYLSDVIGYYDKSAAEARNFYVLFNDAKLGSTLDIYNPMLRRHVKAKVIGRIPANTYNNDVSIIISYSIAKELGIFDTRFKVNIKYEK